MTELQARDCVHDGSFGNVERVLLGFKAVTAWACLGGGGSLWGLGDL